MIPADAHPAATRRALRAALIRNGVVWLVLVAMMAGSTAVAFLPWGAFGLAVEILVSAVAAGLVGTVSMGLDRAPTVDRLAAAAGFLFLVVMFTFAACDLYNRL